MYEIVRQYRQIESQATVATPSVDSSTTAWVAAVVANGGSVSAGRQTTVNNLIVGLKADGVWTKLDRLWLFAGENAASALTDLVADVLATATGSPAFVADRGYTGVDADPATVYIDSNTNTTSLGGNYTTNSAHVSAWSNTNTVSSANGGAIMGFYTAGGSRTYIFPRYPGDVAFIEANEPSPEFAGTASTDSTGHWVADRTDASTETAYRNGAVFANPNMAAATPSNTNCVFLAAHELGSGTNKTGSACQLAMGSIGGGLTGTDVTNFYNRLRTYMTAVGVP